MALHGTWLKGLGGERGRCSAPGGYGRSCLAAARLLSPPSVRAGRPGWRWGITACTAGHSRAWGLRDWGATHTMGAAARWVLPRPHLVVQGAATFATAGTLVARVQAALDSNGTVVVPGPGNAFGDAAASGAGAAPVVSRDRGRARNPSPFVRPPLPLACWCCARYSQSAAASYPMPGRSKQLP